MDSPPKIWLRSQNGWCQSCSKRYEKVYYSHEKFWRFRVGCQTGPKLNHLGEQRGAGVFGFHGDYRMRLGCGFPHMVTNRKLHGLDFPLWLSWWRIRLQCGRPGLNPWVGKIPWRRERLPTPVVWPGEFHGLHRFHGLYSHWKQWLSLSPRESRATLSHRLAQIWDGRGGGMMRLESCAKSNIRMESGFMIQVKQMFLKRLLLIPTQ